MATILPTGRYCGAPAQAMQVAGFRLTETIYRPGTILDAHSHSHWYICYVPQGFYHETADGKTRLCQPHTVAVHPAGETHSERFHHPLTKSLNIQGPGDLPRPQYFEGGIQAHLASRLHQAFLNHNPCCVESLLYELLAALQNTEPHPTREPAWLSRARSLLAETFAHSAPMTTIATQLGVGPSHLATAFRRFHGCTAGDYLRRLRVEHACRQIASGLDLASVALDSGFCDQSHFTRTFQKAMGVTPGQYKAML
ncbi:MAG: AraC family transcriptional regulator [Bryobacteraceae bacterium]